MKSFLCRKTIFYYVSLCSIFSLSYGAVSYNLVDGKPNIYITESSEKIGHTWSNGYVWEKHLIKKFYDLLPNDKQCVVIDLGAQTGCFSLLAKFFPQSRWYSFEPILEAANELRNNLALNEIRNVTVFQVAVTDFSGTATLKMPRMDEWGLSTIGDNVQRFSTVMKREVLCVDLDSFVAQNAINKVDFVKIDTEGSEFFILKGAEKVIERDHPTILMEYNEVNMKQCNVQKSEVHEFLSKHGYEWRLVSNEDIICTPKKNYPLW